MNSALLKSKSVEEAIYSEEELAALHRIPRHVALVMDGNRRWAKQKGFPSLVGHWLGAEVLTQTVSAAKEIGIETLTAYAFSTENWKRAPVEVAALMRLLRTYVLRREAAMIQNGVRLHTIGDLTKLPAEARRAVEQVKWSTRAGIGIDLVLALNYGSRDEMCRALKGITTDCMKGELDPDAIDEEMIGRYLDTAPWGDPDLLIRTGGERRLSNFLLWQLSYTEITVVETLWPDFSPKHLLHQIKEFQQREHRLGT